jgi:dolichol-phosphate mannosyltransferase
MHISIIIPFYNEEGNADGVIKEIQALHPEAEIVAVDDGSTDQTSAVLRLQKNIRLISLPRQSGQSVALYRGIMEAHGDLLVLIDGDGQTSIPDIQKLIAYMPQYDFVNGYRVDRMDSSTRRIASWIANTTRQRVLHDKVLDTGGSPKVMKRECVPHLFPIDGMHRFIPAMMVHAGFRTIEVPVSHRPRVHGENKYDLWQRALRGTMDLIGMKWLLSRHFEMRDEKSRKDPRLPLSKRSATQPANPLHKSEPSEDKPAGR